jgi:CheY-like chemotaxis protein
MANNEHCIMIIDDEPSDLELIKRAFSVSTGKRIILCMNNGKEALAYLMGDGQFADRITNPYPSMLITDLKMPEVDGFEILEYLQNNPTRAIIPTVVLSSSEDPDDIHTAYKLGAYSYFVKPYKFEELCSQINTLLLYWRDNKTPLIDPSGHHLVTDSNGKLGARFCQPN